MMHQQTLAQLYIRKKTSTFTFGTCTFGSTLSLLEHFSTLSLSALALLARHFHFWSTFRHFHFQHLHFWLDTFTFGTLFDTFPFQTTDLLTLFKLSHFRPHQEKDKHFH